MPTTGQELTETAKEQLSLFQRAYESLGEKLMGWFEYLVKLLPNLVLAGIAILFFYLIARGIKQVIIRVLKTWIDNENLVRLTASIVYHLLLLVGLFVSLEALNLSKAVTSLLAGAGVIGLALSFAFQDLATNFISGVLIIVQKPLSVGHYIKTGSHEGYVRKIGFRAIDIENLDGQYIIIPSKEVFQNPLTNFSRLRRRRVTIPVGVSYGDDMRKVEKLLYDTIDNIKEDGIAHPRIDFDGFGDSSVNFLVRFWINYSDAVHYHKAFNTAGMAIKEAFDKHDIMIPFPIRTLDFGIRGGETLKEQLEENVTYKANGKNQEQSA